MKAIQSFFKLYNKRILILAGFLVLIGYGGGYIQEIKWISTISYLIVTILCGLPILIRAILGIKYKAIGIEVLVSIAVLGALLIREYSEAGIVTFLFQLGSFLEQVTLEKTRDSIRSLIKMAPESAICFKDGKQVEVMIEDVKKGDHLLVKAGSKVPVDGYILKGNAYFDEASITGEPQLSHKKENDFVYASSILDLGTVEMIATQVGEDTTFSKIISLVEEAQDTKSPIERFIDKFAKYYTPAVALLAICVGIISQDIPLSITILVLACPGALVIGAPVANVAGIGRGAKEGILLKGGDSIHSFAKTNVVIFDKTGTLTKGKPGVVEILDYSQDREQAFRIAYLVESSSSHPLSTAIQDYVMSQEITIENEEIIHSETKKGKGLIASYQDKSIYIGNQKLMSEFDIKMTLRQEEELLSLQGKGMTTVILAYDTKVQLIFGIADIIKEEASKAISQLYLLGIKDTMMLTGDHYQTAEFVAHELGIKEIRAELLPEDKQKEVKRLQDEGRQVTFVGDGINDSPALASANTAIAMGNGTDVAIETSDVVLMKSNLLYLVKALSLSQQTVRITKQNIFIALSTVILLLIGLMFDWIHMASGMFIHELSILVVILNAMRILYIKKEGNK